VGVRPGDVTAAEAARLGGLDFDVVLEPAGHRNKKGNWRVTPGRFAMHSLTHLYAQAKLREPAP